ncbi:hypothetical protein C1H46_029784 [Malus baccata]|uniref:Uncharacterized protein n=1 Tax=Malus baccata TaxID=106549 RepID=A0A540LDZ3_MALBA|nr:hypothetical protein C1H46_029784 [Malus baccata]
MEVGDFLVGVVDLVEQPLLLGLPSVAVAGEDLDDPDIGFGVLFSPGSHEAHLLFRLP